MLLAFAAGNLLPVQAGVNGKLARSISNPASAALISFTTGFICLAIYLLVTRKFELDLDGAKAQPLWVWTGGLLGAFFVSIVTYLVPKLGASLSFCLIIAGQLAASMIIDQYGLFGVAVSTISFKKLAGIILVLIGVILIRNK